MADQARFHIDQNRQFVSLGQNREQGLEAVGSTRYCQSYAFARCQSCCLRQQLMPIGSTTTPR
ncbi:hypothetical protein WI80_04005 [Burkholderia ubonensis]|nr:hypothetical protein WI80_04005 [Burkholderia ubonensis]KVD33238.1 hypothetical protein WI84_21555 [Burkholderia ubonensis]KVU06585.1 hypothetical protein WK62_10775 [Burkholderia ubonensis]KVU23823.1 hypothetical protein WK63_28555 [Burkholderia ubonensis]